MMPIPRVVMLTFDFTIYLNLNDFRVAKSGAFKTMDTPQTTTTTPSLHQITHFLKEVKDILAECHQTLPCVDSSIEGEYIETQGKFVALFKPDALQYVPSILDMETLTEFYVRTICWFKFACRFGLEVAKQKIPQLQACLLYTSPSPRDS